MGQGTPPLPDDGIYRAILIVLVISVLAGGVIALAGEMVYRDEAISRFGGWVTAICGALYVLFRWLGRREARKREDSGAGTGE